MVQLAKEGPVYSIAWSPSAAEFCVVYGYMPAKATLYSAKNCEKSFDFGTGPRNTALFNPQGNLLLLGGFGNLRGAIQVWSLKDKKQVSDFEAAASTDIRWSPQDGQRILTSTCAPRLREGNGFKVFHYTGSLLYERPISVSQEELWEVAWQQRPKERAPQFAVQFKKAEGIVSSQPQASKVAYRPPGARNSKPGMSGMQQSVLTKALYVEDELPENQKKKEGETMSKSAAKNKKRREAAKKKKEEEQVNGGAAAAAAPVPEVSVYGKLEKSHYINIFVGTPGCPTGRVGRTSARRREARAKASGQAGSDRQAQAAAEGGEAARDQPAGEDQEGGRDRAGAQAAQAVIGEEIPGYVCMTGAKECSLAEEASPVFVINGSLFVTLLLALLSPSIIQKV